ncbi:MAG: hypothetical protein J6W16_04035 [Methanobrevibacter sp.]|nr:hypothetical protein [Methanobrevibacter sp.]
MTIVDEALKQGKKILIPKDLLYSEVTPNDIFVQNDNELEVAKRAAKKYVLNLMNGNVTRINVLNVIDYMQCYMKLMNAGIFITDENREDKYFEIIEAA